MADFVKIGDACFAKIEIRYFIKIEYQSEYCIDVFFDDEQRSVKRLKFDNETSRNTAFDDAVTELTT